ncbi:MAG: type II toxin-antitoxin system RelE/ParE family toxin [Verrucomicrobiota bacterium]
MDYQVALTPKAQADLDAITEYIARDNPIAAVNFGRQLLDRAHSLGINPETGGKFQHRKGIRYTVHYPYLVLYRINKTAQQVEVLRFWHGAQNPKKLRLR